MSMAAASSSQHWGGRSGKGTCVLNGCRNPIDKEIADAAQQWLVDNKRTPGAMDQLLAADVEPAHRHGTVRASALPDWKMSHPELRVPEQIENADVAFFVGGGEGTYLARNWAYWARKPILGVPCFGGAGFQIYLQELNRLRAADRSQSEEYELLNQVGSDVDEYAKDLWCFPSDLVPPGRCSSSCRSKEEAGRVQVL
jgi:hypothetical protein